MNDKSNFLATPVPLEILDEQQYLDRIASDIKQAKPGGRALLTTMSFNSQEPPIARIVEELKAASQRGVNTCLGVDAYSFLVGEQDTKTGPLLYKSTLSNKISEPFYSNLQALHSLNQNKGRHTITNIPPRPLMNPFAGRSHIKVGIVDDRVYVGGCNLFFAYRQDCMVGWRDKRTADWLYDLLSQVIETGHTQTAIKHDRAFAVDQNTELLVDAGHKNGSVIYERALRLVDDTEEDILLLGQYAPDKDMAQKLKAAQERGVSVRVYHNNPTKAGNLAQYWQKLSVSRSVLGGDALKQLPSEHRFLHSKILASEKAAMRGSHNYHKLGVRWGTAEATLVREDRDFARYVSQFAMRQIANG